MSEKSASGEPAAGAAPPQTAEKAKSTGSGDEAKDKNGKAEDGGAGKGGRFRTKAKPFLKDVKEVLYDMMFPSRSDPDLALRLQREKMTGKPVVGKQILVAVDGSKGGDVALELAVRLADIDDDLLLLLTVVHDWNAEDTRFFDIVPINASYHKDAQQEARNAGKFVVTERSQKLSQQGYNVRALVLKGDPRESISLEIKKRKIDLLVIARNRHAMPRKVDVKAGHVPVPRKTSGEVTDFLVKYARCSVMVAYDPDALRPRTERIADVVNAAAVPVAAVPAEVVKRAKGQLSGEYHYDEKRKSRRNTSSNAKEKDGKPTEMEEEKADNVEETKRKKEPETNN